MKCLLCSKASTSSTPHLEEMHIESSPASFSTPQPCESPGSACGAIPVDQFSEVRPLDFTSCPRIQLQKLCFISEGCNEDKHIRACWWWDCRCRSGGGGWRTAGGYRCSTFLLMPVWHRVLLTWYTQISEHFSIDKGCIHLWRLWDHVIIYLQEMG